jgi:xylulokinase
MTLLIGIDLGTTGCKASVYDQTGGCLGEGYLEYGLITLSSTEIEQDPCAWWDLTIKAVQEALQNAKVDGHRVRAISVSSQGISFVLVDRAGQPLANAINWLDSRAVAESAQILERYPPEALFRITGKRAASFYMLPKLLWLQKNRPDLWRQADKILMGHDFLLHRLSGEYFTDHSMAGGTLLYDLQRLDWNPEFLDVFQIPRRLLPEIHWAGTPVGKIRPEAAESLGISKDVVVSVGGQDQKVAALGAGIDDKTATLSMGTATTLTQLMRAPHTDDRMRIPTFTFVQPERWELEGVVGTGAGSFRWYRDTVGGRESYQDLDQEAGQSPPGSGGVFFYPHLTGATSPHWEGQARGTFYGLSLATQRGDMTRAVLEGVAYQVRENLSVAEQIAGPVERLIVFGGGAKSSLWREIVSNILNRPLAFTPTVEAAGLGAAILAGVGCGLFSSLEQARQAMVRIAEQRQPNRETAVSYERLFEQYQRLEKILLKV